MITALLPSEARPQWHSCSHARRGGVWGHCPGAGHAGPGGFTPNGLAGGLCIQHSNDCRFLPGTRVLTGDFSCDPRSLILLRYLEAPPPCPSPVVSLRSGRPSGPQSPNRYAAKSLGETDKTNPKPVARRQSHIPPSPDLTW